MFDAPMTLGAQIEVRANDQTVGARVLHKERIHTSPTGSVQLLFLDKSTLSIAPNTSLVIDEFVYDPNAGTGKLAASLTRGVFRFVGGKLSKQDNAVTMRLARGTPMIRVSDSSPRLSSDKLQAR